MAQPPSQHLRVGVIAKTGLLLSRGREDFFDFESSLLRLKYTHVADCKPQTPPGRRWDFALQLGSERFLQIKRGPAKKGSRLDAHKQRNYDSLLSWYFSDRDIAERAPRSNRTETRERKLKKVLEHTRAGRYSKAMRLISSHGLGDSTSNDIREQMRRKFPNRKSDVGPLSAYIGNGTPVAAKVTSDQIVKAIRNLAPGTAPGPDGFHAEHFKMALKAQNLEIGETVTAELARFATAFGAGLLPAHTYYIGSSSWLVPVIKAKITSATVKVPCRPVCIGPTSQFSKIRFLIPKVGR